jgi:GNAT superfamily N-acetyltransferase
MKAGSSSTAVTTKSVTKKKTQAQIEASRNEYIMLLRGALMTQTGRDRNVFKDFAGAMGTYSKGDDLNATIEFLTGSKMHSRLTDWAVELTKTNMEDLYEETGYGWEDGPKESELTEECARILVVRRAVAEGAKEGAEGAPIAYIHFRFTLQGEIHQTVSGEPALFVYDVQVAEEAQGRGLGKRLMQLMELIAAKHQMRHVMVRTIGEDPRTINFINTKLKGYGAGEGGGVGGGVLGIASVSRFCTLFVSMGCLTRACVFSVCVCVQCVCVQCVCTQCVCVCTVRGRPFVCNVRMSIIV